jgi:hypothetical protein
MGNAFFSVKLPQSDAERATVLGSEAKRNGDGRAPATNTADTNG